jgi:HEAT repeat protein
MKLKNRTLLVTTTVLLTSAVVLGTKTPEDQAWRLLQSGSMEKMPEVRVIAVGALGLLIKNPTAERMAEKALQDRDPTVRTAAARALGRMRSAKSIPQLRRALSDRENSVVMAAAHALVALHDPAGYDLYYSVLTGERKKGQGLIAQEMDVLRDPQTVAEFCLEEGIGFLPYGGYGLSAEKFIKAEAQGESSAKALAAKALAKDPDPHSGEALVRALSDKSWLVREAALESIAERADPSLLAGTQVAMSDQDDRVRYVAAAAVIRLADSDSAKHRVDAYSRQGSIR